jgi:GNAT superfamily N-acetyltransferase
MTATSAIILRPATDRDIDTLSTLCQRSKAMWGYSDAFMAACREELTIYGSDLESTTVFVAVRDHQIVGMVQQSLTGKAAELHRLYVEPDAAFTGVGTTLLAWAMNESRVRGATALWIDADPNALPFYSKYGALKKSESPSGSIPGRMLPRLCVDLNS